jgi:hypothetical protein
MAFLHLARYPPLPATQRFSDSLAKFAAAHDKPTLCHETITWAFPLLIREVARYRRIAGYSETILRLREEFARSYGGDVRLLFGQFVTTHSTGAKCF